MGQTSTKPIGTTCGLMIVLPKNAHRISRSPTMSAGEDNHRRKRRPMGVLNKRND